MGHGAKVTCPRCGLEREGRKGRGERLCRDCYETDPGWPESIRMMLAVS
jgi:NMD protein affecting ribosome stability and mRNA decay